MEAPSPFRFPPRESLAPLSAERVNASSRVSSKTTAATATATATSTATESDYAENESPQSSPTRRTAKLFSDYDPKRHSPVKQSGFPLPQSPSLAEIHAFRTHGRTNSDVQGLVKRFEHLDVRDRDAESEDRRKRHEAELRRAQMAREEAETDVKRLREEVRRLKKEGDDERDRERKVSKRLEFVVEEFSNFKQTQTSQLSVYEKEVRKTRKEAFKSSSAVLKLQEELKSTRNTLRITQAAHDMEKRKVEQRDQQTFEAEYQLVAVQQELDTLRTHVKVVEEEREALKTSLKEEEVARIAAEGMIALPQANHDEDLMSPQAKRRSPHKRPASPLSDDKENAGVVTKKMLESRQMADELRRERMRREQAEELTDFLRLECHFRCCSCNSRRSSKHSALFDTNPFADALNRIRSDMRAVLPLQISEQEGNGSESSVRIKRERKPVVQSKSDDVEMTQPEELVVAESLDRSMTMDRKPLDTKDEDEHEHAIIDVEEPIAPHSTPLEAELLLDCEPSSLPATRRVPLLPSWHHPHSNPRHTAKPSMVRTVTTTTTIPMQFTPQKLRHTPELDEAYENIPPAMSPHNKSGSAPLFDREAALAAIAYRRGRAKSLANGQATPRKQMLEGVVNMKERRDVSAPALGQTEKVKGTKNGGPGGVGSAGRTR